MQVSVGNGEIRIHLGSLMDAMSDEDKRQVIAHLACEEKIVESVVNMLATGKCDAGGFVHPAILEPYRLQILESMQPLTMEAVKQIIDSRERINAEYHRHNEWGWRLLMAWRDRNERSGNYEEAPAIPDWAVPPDALDKDALAELRKHAKE